MKCGDLYLQMTYSDGSKGVAFMSIPDDHADVALMSFAHAMKYRARREKKLLVIDAVPRWKRPFLKLLGIMVQS